MTIIVHYTRTMTLELAADVTPEERDELIRAALPEGAKVSALSKTGADGDLHTLGCNEEHCPHYSCNTDPEDCWFCDECEPEEDDEP